MIFFLETFKKNDSYCLFLKFIIFICLKNKKYIFLNYNRCKLLIITQKNKRASKHAHKRVFRGQCYNKNNDNLLKPTRAFFFSLSLRFASLSVVLIFSLSSLYHSFPFIYFFFLLLLLQKALKGWILDFEFGFERLDFVVVIS